jgi:hypothetical protein
MAWRRDRIQDNRWKRLRLPARPPRPDTRFRDHGRRKFPWHAVAVAAIVAVLAAFALTAPGRDSVTRARPHPTPVALTIESAPQSDRPDSGPALPEATLTIGPNAQAVNVPRSFFGISTEYWTLPLLERNMPVLERVISLLHVPGDGPLVLRVGGDSADHAFWDPKSPRRMPAWAFQLTPTWLARLGSLVREDRLRLIVDLNLVTDTPLTAAAWAHAAEDSLPHGSIVAFEIGNEPDLYSRRYWVRTIARSPFETLRLPIELTPSTYVEDFAAYARAIGENAPDIPLVGPAVAHPRVSAGFISTLIQDERSELGGVTGHLYPYSACVRDPKSSSYPTIARLLSGQASAGLAADVARAVADAHAAGLKFRLTELNSVTCGGKPGVSDTFATALWAPDALFTLMRAGVDGANVHVRENAVNAAFTLNARGLQPRPLLYGLLLFTRALGPHAKLVRLRLDAARSLNLSAWAVHVAGDSLHVVVLDKGTHTVRLRLRLPATRPATVQSLLAPSVSSRTGVTLAGQHLGADGRWYGQRHVQTILPSHRGYELVVPQHSAALLEVRLNPRVPGRGLASHGGALVRHRLVHRARPAV